MSDSVLASFRLPASVLQNIVAYNYSTAVSLRATCRHLDGAFGRDVRDFLGALIAIEATVVDRDALQAELSATSGLILSTDSIQESHFGSSFATSAQAPDAILW